MRIRETTPWPDELRYRRAAWRCSGALMGALIGWILGLFNTIEPLTSAMVLAACGLTAGACVGAAAGFLVQALPRGQRALLSGTGNERD
ncbi:hypothetical protein MMAD_01660 [Mycolicibacterium madagascariense]|uniref:Uncharacterized protein n=1 Tax=Mycolicibacterium madagascariense TaxID=212765 RepID=A0A7I7XB81_9MYCO|nr:hypothetical protein [Mycolicibacterium madagascariense]MCV7013410.1 hypothetical protein [Mycolicibacterium madagascariense]BBZ25871.1 hypothetical protein MMAD_01660 [Mycolicibacterium madagascariense]